MMGRLNLMGRLMGGLNLMGRLMGRLMGGLMGWMDVFLLTVAWGQGRVRPLLHLQRVLLGGG